jgi:hypothetical protein
MPMPEMHEIPEWVTRGKTIRQLIKELESFEDQGLEVRISLDYGDRHHAISLVCKDGSYCVLVNAKEYYKTDWQDFMNKPDDEIT